MAKLHVNITPTCAQPSNPTCDSSCDDYSQRIIARLQASSLKEPLAYEKDSYELAIRIINRVSEGRIVDPFFYAHCWYYGQTPENLDKRIAQYRSWRLNARTV